MDPKILLIHCAESGSRALQNLGAHGTKLTGNIKTFELPCSGRINDVLVMETLEHGYDGVLIVACRKDNCRYLDGNLRAGARIERVQALLKDAGIEGKAVDIIYTAPDEGIRLSKRIQEFQSSLTKGAVVS